jgi:DHA1 family bicyclomycin/chloramphenicol resistance-like MFS transporter
MSKLYGNHHFFLIIVTMMMSVGLFATDIYLPALPEMAIHFGCSQADIQFSFTIFLLGLAACQLLAGRLSDYFGRRRVAIAGFSVFTIFSFLCAEATSLEQLNLFRLIQACGGGVGSVIGRVLIVDRYNRQESVKIFSTVFPIVGLSSAIGPFIGGYLTHFWGWQSTFVFISFFGLFILISTIAYLDNRTPIQVQPVLETPVVKTRAYLSVMNNAEFLGYALIICACYCTFRSYSVESPFVFSNQGYEAEEMGNFYISLSFSYLVGNLIAKKLINRFSLNKVLKIGIFILITGGCLMIASTSLLADSPYALIIPMSVITLGNGFLFPVASAGALTAVSNTFAGTASGLMGSMQFILAAVCTYWIGELCQGDAISLSIFMSAIIFLGLCSFLLLVYRGKKIVTLP